MIGLTTRMVTDVAEFESLAGIWDDLLQTADHENTIYLTHEWLSTWWRHFGDGKKLHVLLFERHGRVIGIIPLMRNEYRLGMIRVRLLESVGAVNCNYVWLVSPENREAVASAFLSYMEETLSRDRLFLRLRFVPEDSTLLSLVRGCDHVTPRLAIEEKTLTLAPYIELPASWDELFLSLSGKRRWVLRRSLRLLEEEYQVEFQQCAGDSLVQSLDEFFEVHQRRWHSVNVRGMFWDPRMRGFYRDMAARFEDRGWLRFSRLNADGDMAYGQIGFVYNGKFYAAAVARSTRYSKYSVGHVHHQFVLKDAIRQGLREFDFLQGDEPYKFYWTKSARRYQQVTLIGGGRCPALRLRFLRAFFRAYNMRWFGLRESYYLRRLRKREEKEWRRLGSWQIRVESG
jgi:CelD/BcsL family acetyltransferase involved in cellulose biosynthesis